jgi:hypothetical protein
MCQLREISRKTPRSRRPNNPRDERKTFSSSSVGLASPYALEEPVHAHQHEEIDDRDANQEEHRHQRADHAADLDQPGEALLQTARSQSNDQRGGKHDRGVAEREEEADCDRPLALLHQLAGDVVDRGDVIRVDRVPQSEAIGDQSGR